MREGEGQEGVSEGRGGARCREWEGEGQEVVSEGKGGARSGECGKGRGKI